MTSRAVGVVAIVALVGCTSSDELDVKIDTGVVHGAKTGTIRSFLGVPYAAAPVGDLRWRAPQPAATWSGTRQAIAIGAGCPQMGGLLTSVSDLEEDCLFANVWTPSAAHDLPVMVWIHGGAFIGGSGGDKWFDGTSLAQHGVVVVTINYRLGALGFLAHPALDTEDPAYPTSGNYGLEDQRAALQWVQRNIAAFGGDPTRVTVFGESAGAISVGVHYTSTRTSGLFRAAIAESGVFVDAATTIHAQATAAGSLLGGMLGCAGTDAAAIACMRGLSVDTILAATATPPPAMQMPGGLFYQSSELGVSLPNIDGFVIALAPSQLLAQGPPEPRPLLLGTNKDEGTLFQWSVLSMPVADETQYRAALAVRFGASNVDAIVAQYPVASYASAADALSAVTGDYFFVCSTRTAARSALRAGAPVFRYSFEHALDNLVDASLGVCHSSELPFVFGDVGPVYPLGQVGTSGAPLSQQMQTYWTSFAKNLDPNDASVAAWPPYASADPYQLLDVPVSSAMALEQPACDFWDALPPG